MIEHISFPKIAQFRNVITEITHASRYDGKDELGNPIYNNVKLPILTWIGTVKLHGTNAGIVLHDGEIYAQSRSRILSIQNDNYGFAAYVESTKDYWKNKLSELNMGSCVVFGEWAGPGIQSDVGISQINECAFFPFSLYKFTNNQNKVCVDNWLWDDRNYENKSYPVKSFEHYSINIDMNHPQLAQNKLIHFTEKIEEQCPIARSFNIEGVGEGIVWTTIYKDQIYRFKVKGEKHSVSKVKTLASVNPEQLKSCFCANLCNA